MLPEAGAWMARDELVAEMDAQPIGVGLEQQALPGIQGGHRVVVRIQRHPELLGGPYRAHPRQIERRGIERFQMRALGLEVIDRALLGPLVVNLGTSPRTEAS